jgi:hypothetical protein
VLANVLAKVPVHGAAHGFVPGRSTLSNATPHVGAGVVVNTDLTDFFGTITFPRVLGIFRQLGYSPAVATVFALLCTEAPRRRVTYAGRPLLVATGFRALPQGACTSPALSNLAARRLDSRLAGIAASSASLHALRRRPHVLRPRRRRQGRLPARPRPPHRPRRRLRRERGEDARAAAKRPTDGDGRRGERSAERPARGAPAAARDPAQGRLGRPGRPEPRGHPHFEAWVRGMVAYVRMVSPGQGAPLREALAKLSPEAGP